MITMSRYHMPDDGKGKRQSAKSSVDVPLTVGGEDSSVAPAFAIAAWVLVFRTAARLAASAMQLVEVLVPRG